VTVKLVIALPHSLYTQLASAARLSCQPVTQFVREIVEADIATRKLATILPQPEPDRSAAEKMRAYRARRSSL